MLGEADYYLVVVILACPCGHHDVGIPVFVPGGDHNAGLGGGDKCVVGAEILPSGYFLNCLVHIICVFSVFFTCCKGDDCGEDKDCS